MVVSGQFVKVNLLKRKTVTFKSYVMEFFIGQVGVHGRAVNSVRQHVPEHVSIKMLNLKLKLIILTVKGAQNLDRIRRTMAQIKSPRVRVRPKIALMAQTGYH